MCELELLQGVDLKEYCGALSKALLSNLTHQQQKIRLSALQAIGAIVPLNVTVLKETLPCIARLNVDRAHQLREEVSRQSPAILHPKHSITYTRSWLTCMAHSNCLPSHTLGIIVPRTFFAYDALYVRA